MFTQISVTGKLTIDTKKSFSPIDLNEENIYLSVLRTFIQKGGADCRRCVLRQKNYLP